MSSTVQQFNIQYNREEDRLILKMLLSDNGEIRLWLTRRYTQMMLAAFGQVTEGVAEEAATQHHTQEVKAFQQEVALSNSNFKDEYRAEQVASTPLGATPLLVSRLQLEKAGERNFTVSMGEPQQGGKQININFDMEMIHALMKLIIDASRSADWGGAGRSVEEVEVIPSQYPDKVLH